MTMYELSFVDFRLFLSGSSSQVAATAYSAYQGSMLSHCWPSSRSLRLTPATFTCEAPCAVPTVANAAAGGICKEARGTARGQLNPEQANSPCSMVRSLSY